MKTTMKEEPRGQATRGTMKAVRMHKYGGPEVLKYEEIPVPKPGQGEVLLRVHAAGVNPVDWKVREGYRKGATPLPIVPGWDVSGVVEALGPGVSLWKAGDEVFGRGDSTRDGAYAEYMVIRESDVARKPASVDHVHAAAIPIAGLTAWQALFDVANLSDGQTVLIHGGAGGVGHFAVQLARWKGAHVIATATGRTVGFVAEMGAHEVIDFKAARFEDAVRDVDVVLDIIGGDTQKRSWQVLKKGGILVSTVGITSPEGPAEHGVRGEAMVAHSDAEDLAEIAELVESGHVKPVVHVILPLNEAANAHELLQQGGIRGKIVLKVV